VLRAVYGSPAQRRRRRTARALLVVKHGLRGLLFSWPLYLLGAAAVAMPGRYSWLLGLVLVPAVWFSAAILVRGLREDCARYLDQVVLKPGALRRILFPS